MTVEPRRLRLVYKFMKGRPEGLFNHSVHVFESWTTIIDVAMMEWLSDSGGKLYENYNTTGERWFFKDKALCMMFIMRWHGVDTEEIYQNARRR